MKVQGTSPFFRLGQSEGEITSTEIQEVTEVPIYGCSVCMDKNGNGFLKVVILFSDPVVSVRKRESDIS